MHKKRIAVIFGGNSTEYEVSLQSAAAVLEHINNDKFEVVPIGITRDGDWYHYTGEYDKIADLILRAEELRSALRNSIVRTLQESYPQACSPHCG